MTDKHKLSLTGGSWSSATGVTPRGSNRSIQACTPCKESKRKCSGTLPCHRCSSLNRSQLCSFAAVPTRESSCSVDGHPGPKRPPLLSPETLYANKLRERINHLEHVLKDMAEGAGVEGLDSLLAEMGDDEDEKTRGIQKAVQVLRESRIQRNMDINPSTSSTNSSFPNRTPNTPFDNQDQPLGNLPVAPVLLSNDPHYIGPSSSSAYAQNLIQNLSHHHPPSFPALLTPGIGAQCDGGSLVDRLLLEAVNKRAKSFPLPSQDLRDKLVDAYFKEVHLMWPILHRATFELELRNGTADRIPSFRRLVFSVLALGCRFVTDPRIPVPESAKLGDEEQTAHTRGFLYFLAASSTITESNLAHVVPPDLCDVQAAVLGVLWSIGATSFMVSWQRVGIAIRSAIDVGCHSELSPYWTRSPLEDQLRKRAFHSLAAFDRIISTQLSRPLALQDFDLNLALPLDITDTALSSWSSFSLPTPPAPSTTLTPVTAWLQLVKLTELLAETSQAMHGTKRNSRTRGVEEVRDEMRRIDSLLNEWLAAVPESLKWDSHAENLDTMTMSATLHAIFYHTQILLHRDFFAFNPRGDTCSPSTAICSHAARSASKIYNFASRMGILGRLFWFAPQYGIIAVLTLTILILQQSSKKGTINLTSPAAQDIKLNVAAILQLAPSTLFSVNFRKKMKLFERNNTLGMVAQLFDLSSVLSNDRESIFTTTDSSTSTTPGSLSSSLSRTPELLPGPQDGLSPPVVDPILAISPLPFPLPATTPTLISASKIQQLEVPLTLPFDVSSFFGRWEDKQEEQSSTQNSVDSDWQRWISAEGETLFNYDYFSGAM